MIGTTITLRNVPPALHRSLKENAKRNNRSLNQEAIHALESSLADSQEHRSALRQPPPVRSAGKILVPLEHLNSRADDLIGQGA